MENIVNSYDFISKYKSVGKERFYRFLISYGIGKLVKIKDGYDTDVAAPEIELLDYHDRFMIAFRKGQGDDYLELAKLFRRAAHKIYRASVKSNLIKQRDPRFLSIVLKVARK